MTLKEYVFELKDRLMLPHGTYGFGDISDHDDNFHTNEMLKRDVHDARKTLIIHARLFIKSWGLSLIADQYEYGFPLRCLKVDRITHTYSTTHDQIKYIDPSRFFDGFSPTQTGTTPRVWSIAETKAEVHRFWESDTDDYVTTSSITSSTGLNHIYDQYANYGVVESGEYPEEDDVVWSDTDDSYANVNYFDMETIVTTVTASGGSATTLTTADSLTNAKEGHLVYNTTDSSWGFITSINATTGEITVSKWYGGTTGYPENLDSCKIGIANHIYLKTLNEFTTRAFQGGSDNTPTADDTYRLQDKFNTVQTIFFSPVPSTTDTTGTESLTIWGSAEPDQMIEDNDPCPVPDVWSDHLIDLAHILSLKRQPDKLGETDVLRQMQKDKIAEIKRNASVQQLGEAHNIYDNINPAASGLNLYVAH